MAMPKQVEQEIKALEELERQLQVTPEAEPDKAPEEPEVVETTAQVEPTPQAVEPVEPKEDWEHKFKTLQGMYKADLEREVRERMAQTETHVAQLQQQLSLLQKTPKEQPQQDTFVTDRDREEYGEELIDLQRRVTKEVFGQYETKLDAYEQKIAALEQRLMQTGNQVGEMTFEQRLLRAVPDFDQINADPKWVAWLDEVLPDVNVSRRTFAQQAYAKGDVDAVKRFIDVFRAAHTSKKPDARKSELERQVTPSRNATTGTTSVQPQGKLYSYTDWVTATQQVDVLVSRGKYVEAEKLEAELANAMQEGRVST